MIKAKYKMIEYYRGGIITTFQGGGGVGKSHVMNTGLYPLGLTITTKYC